MRLNFCLIALTTCLTSCTTNPPETSTIPTDSLTLAAGQLLFSQNCGACHNFKEDGIGPQLGGLTKSVSADWIKNFVRDPKGIIESGDERAKELFGKYKAIMPPFAHYSDDQLNGLIAFIHSKPTPDLRKATLDPNALKDPIPEKIPMSDLVIEMEVLAQIPASSNEQQLTRIAKMDVHPVTKKLMVMDLRGKLYQLNGSTPEVYMDIEKLKPNFIHKPGLGTGLGSFAFHPEFSKNGLIYTSHTEAAGSAKADFNFADSIEVALQWVLSEWKTKEPGTSPFSGEGRELFRIDMESQIHGMQELVFNPVAKKGGEDYGLLYIGIGDGGSAEHGYGFLCHTVEKLWGTVIRIDPTGQDSDNGNYGIPLTNPFVKSTDPNVRKEIFAYGFRNPHRITWSKSGQMLVSNIGHHLVESLYIVPAGSDAGWPLREGKFLIDPTQNMHNIYPVPFDDSKNNFNYPVAQYDHDEGNAIAGGYEYWGSMIPELKGKFLFGDIVQGRLFYVEMGDLKLGSQAPIKEWRVSVGGKIKTLKELTGTDKVDERFGRDGNGEMYITTKPDGKVYRLVKARN
jgi:glucose/arabinose dehydrogenase/mono/diheme cytochrome c family protein